MHDPSPSPPYPAVGDGPAADGVSGNPAHAALQIPNSSRAMQPTPAPADAEADSMTEAGLLGGPWPDPSSLARTGPAGMLGELLFGPPNDQDRPQLIVFTHSAGAWPSLLGTLALSWQAHWPAAWLALPAGPVSLRRTPDGMDPERAEISGISGGRAWTTVPAANMAPRDVEAAAAALRRRIRDIQDQIGVEPDRTVLVGFHQGGSVLLEISLAPPRIAALTLAFGSRLIGTPPFHAPSRTRIALVYGGDDPTLRPGAPEQTQRSLESTGALVTLSVVPGEGRYGIGTPMLEAGMRCLEAALGPPLREPVRSNFLPH